MKRQIVAGVSREAKFQVSAFFFRAETTAGSRMSGAVVSFSPGKDDDGTSLPIHGTNDDGGDRSPDLTLNVRTMATCRSTRSQSTERPRPAMRLAIEAGFKLHVKRQPAVFADFDGRSSPGSSGFGGFMDRW